MLLDVRRMALPIRLQDLRRLVKRASRSTDNYSYALNVEQGHFLEESQPAGRLLVLELGPMLQAVAWRLLSLDIVAA